MSSQCPAFPLGNDFGPLAGVSAPCLRSASESQLHLPPSVMTPLSRPSVQRHTGSLCSAGSRSPQHWFTGARSSAGPLGVETKTTQTRRRVSTPAGLDCLPSAGATIRITRLD
ncbi:hypothetical protein AOLI_G00177480 [Acnodon oligacanthus]